MQAACRVAGCLLVAAMAARADAGAVTGWRGDGTGAFASARPPLRWGPDSNVVWKTKLPDWSNASPILVGDRLFVCAEPATLIGVSAADGRILWTGSNTYADILPPDQQEAGRVRQTRVVGARAELQKAERNLKKLETQLTNVTAEARAAIERELARARQGIEPLRSEAAALADYALPEAHPVNGYSTPTPVSDGQFVYAVFGNGVAAGYDLGGTRRWARVVEKPTLGWGHSASPVLVGGRLIVHIRQLVALDPATGATVWQAASAPHWGADVAARVRETDVVVTPGGDIVKAADGVPLARGLANLDYCAALVEGGVAYFAQHGGKAVELSAAPRALWDTKPENERYYASPVLTDGVLYAMMQKSVLSLIDATSGAVIASAPLNLGGTAYPSLARAGGYVYASSDSGVTVVLKTGRRIEPVATNRLEAFRSSPLFAGQRLYVRGLQHLYCIGPSE